MLAVRTALFACVLLAACDGNPFQAQEPDGGGGGTPVVENPSVATLPGTEVPRTNEGITRFEEQGKGPNVEGSAPEVVGNGFAFKDGKINYNRQADTFEVDNLAFDGGNVYTRSPAFRNGRAGPDIGPARMYEGAGVVPDTQTGELIDQFSYRALYGESESGQARFAIVRTGAYRGYGFGGFIYERSGGVGFPELTPRTNQAKYAGTYAGLRDFDGRGGMQVTSGDMELAIDFDDFNPDESGLQFANGIYGSISNRRIFDLEGNDITAGVIAEINEDKNLTISSLPTLQLFTGPGSLDANGEAEGNIANTLDGERFESGKYYAVLSGNKAEEILGVIVVSSQIGDYTARETGGFILYHR